MNSDLMPEDILKPQLLSTLALVFSLEEPLTSMVIGQGLINHSWKLNTPNGNFILQKINTAVFRHPENIENNLRVISEYLSSHHPGYNFIAPVPASDGKGMIRITGEGYFRLFPFVEGSVSKDVTETPEQAFEAAIQFGRFTRLLSGLDVSQLKVTIPGFHDLSWRYEQFVTALEHGNTERIKGSAILIAEMQEHSGIVREYESILANPDFRLRVTHHDTKISNILFDKNDKGICVIDLDTVMPGYFFSDVGDMMRTYVCPVSEEEKDFSKILIREEFYKAIVRGYYGEMKNELTDKEKDHFFYAGKFMIYMQALRFLTDHINNDMYYGAAYPGHNFIRAGNQAMLLKRLIEKEAELTGTISI